MARVVQTLPLYLMIEKLIKQLLKYVHKFTLTGSFFFNGKVSSSKKHQQHG